MWILTNLCALLKMQIAQVQFLNTSIVPSNSYFRFLLPKFITVGQCSLVSRGGLIWLAPPFACMTLSQPEPSVTVLSYGVGCICHVKWGFQFLLHQLEMSPLDSMLRKTRTSASLISPSQPLLLPSALPSGLFLLCCPHGWHIYCIVYNHD